jgi:hypothetical protein
VAMGSSVDSYTPCQFIEYPPANIVPGSNIVHAGIAKAEDKAF